MNSKTSDEILFNFVSNRLKYFRIQNGFTNYEHLAYEIGISRSQYGRYEKGGNMKLSHLMALLFQWNIIKKIKMLNQ